MTTSESRKSELRNHAAEIWSIADMLRGPYKRSEYGQVILPLTLMRRLDQAMDDTKKDVVAEAAKRRASGVDNPERLLRIVAKRSFFNEYPQRLPELIKDPKNLGTYLRNYIDGYSEYAHAVFANFDFEKQIQKLETHDLLHAVVTRICDVNLDPKVVSNLEMGYTFEELIRKFAESSNDEAGAHFTPREVIRLMVNLLVGTDDEALSGAAPIRTVYDCACGTGGMLSEAELHIKALNENATVHLYGQEVNEQSFAICLADMLIRGQDPARVIRNNTLTTDGHAGETFHYGIANPPFGTDWKAEYKSVKAKYEEEGPEGRFGAGLPGKDDGQTLFLQQLLSKMRPSVDGAGEPIEGGGARVAIVLSTSPLYSAPAAGIRRKIMEADLLEAVVALPEQLFYNTNIPTFIWVLSNRKELSRKGLVQLIDARGMWEPMEKSLGSKRRRLDPFVDAITKLHGGFEEGPHVKILECDTMAFREVEIEHPLRGTLRVDPDALAALSAGGLKVDAETSTRRRTLNEHLLTALHACAEADLESTLVRARVQAAIDTAPTKVPKALLDEVFDALVQRDRGADPLKDFSGLDRADQRRRETELVPRSVDVDLFMSEHVLPFAPGASACPTDKVSYEIPFNRVFFESGEEPNYEQLDSRLHDVESALANALRSEEA